MYCPLKGVYIEAFNMHCGMTAQIIEWKYCITYRIVQGVEKIVLQIYMVYMNEICVESEGAVQHLGGPVVASPKYDYLSYWVKGLISKY